MSSVIVLGVGSGGDEGGVGGWTADAAASFCVLEKGVDAITPVEAMITAPVCLSK